MSEFSHFSFETEIKGNFLHFLLCHIPLNQNHEQCHHTKKKPYCYVFPPRFLNKRGPCASLFGRGEAYIKEALELQNYRNIVVRVFDSTRKHKGIIARDLCGWKISSKWITHESYGLMDRRCRIGLLDLQCVHLKPHFCMRDNLRYKVKFYPFDDGFEITSI